MRGEPYEIPLLTHSAVLRAMLETATSGETPVDIDLSYLALKRVITFVNAKVVLPVMPEPGVYFADLGHKSFRDVYEFSVKYECDTIKNALDVIITDFLKQIEAITEASSYNGQAYIRQTDLDKLIKLLISIHLPLLGIAKVAEALKPGWRIPFFRAAFDQDDKLSTSPHLDMERFAEKFKEVMNVRQ